MHTLNTLPKLINAKYGLRDKLHELNREMVMRDRMEGWRLDYQDNTGLVHNVKTGAIYGRYVNAMNDKFKLVKEGK